jgi:hypothetical protein
VPARRGSADVFIGTTRSTRYSTKENLMKLKTAIACLMGLATAHFNCWATAPQGDPFTLVQGGIANMTAGQSYASAFDIGLFYGIGTDTLTSAVITLNFEGADLRDSAALSTTKVITRTNPDRADYITRYADPLDRVSVLFGQFKRQSATIDDGANAYEGPSVVVSTTPVYGTDLKCHGLFVSVCEEFSYLAGYDRNLDLTSGYKGAFSYSSLLDATTLAQLSSTGYLRYGFTVLSGGASLKSASLTFVAAPVPEPASTSLAVCGLGLLAALYRRRRQEEGDEPCKVRK